MIVVATDNLGLGRINCTNDVDLVYNIGLQYSNLEVLHLLHNITLSSLLRVLPS